MVVQRIAGKVFLSALAFVVMWIVVFSVFLCGCSIMRISRSYDVGGIKKETGTAFGLYDEAVSNFTMARRDQKSKDDVLEETAGASVQWTHESGRDVSLELLRVAADAIHAYLATQTPAPEVEQIIPLPE